MREIGFSVQVVPDPFDRELFVGIRKNDQVSD
jgi:hypothetical protein